MKIPEFLQGNSPKRLLQGAAGGALLTIVIGFSWVGTGFGWYTASGAEELARKATSSAMVSALAPICAEKFRLAANAEASLVELNKANSWNRSDLIEKAGFATFSGSKAPDRQVAEGCVAMLLGGKDK